MYVALKKANDEYTDKLSSSKAAWDKVLYKLCWAVDEPVRLLDEGRKLYVEVMSLVEILDDDQADLVQTNVDFWLAEPIDSLHSVHHKTSATSCHTHTGHDYQSISTKSEALCITTLLHSV